MMHNKLLVAVSIILNVLFTIHILYNISTTWSPTWTNRAASEAEAAASVSCSGHGRAYVDGLGVLDGHKPPCECHNCYTGKDCSFFVPDCPVDADSGDPLFLEPFWIRNAEGSAVVESGWHRMSYSYEGDASAWKRSERNDNMTQVIEIVTSPNNPDGKLKRAVLDGPNVKNIHDYAYYWPYFSPITHPVDEDLSLFSLSKTTGHAGSRFGWALVKDKAVYEKMKTYIILNTMGVSKDTQLHALQLLKVVIGDGGDEIFSFGYGTLKKRWEILNKIFSMSTRFSLETIKPEYCNYFKKVREFTPSYAWVKCERPEDKNCYEIFRAVKITGRNGNVFGSEERFVRLSLIRSQDDFDQLIAILKKFVSKEAVVVDSV
ncbi:unnamed protein product [Arabidopsis arenosa]|uniref:Uncharacterized protein n=1 Tax=Arabidopsis arenosa TaxID=38785 RepID=A0A8S1ZK81_ARAAE|nr:unnamed protein product [Arabidopsis arenosa]